MKYKPGKLRCFVCDEMFDYRLIFNTSIWCEICNSYISQVCGNCRWTGDMINKHIDIEHQSVELV